MARKHLHIKSAAISKIIALSMILMLSQATFAETNKKLTIKVDGEYYERDYPENLDDANALIDQMAEMINNADSTIVNLKKQQTEENDELKNQIAKLQSELASVTSSLSSAESSIEPAKDAVADYSKTNTRFDVNLAIGPVFGFGDSATGTHAEVIGNYRIFRNFHIGGSVFFDTFSNTSRNFDLGVGVVLGYSVY